MIKVKDVKFATYGVSDIDAQESFMLDFGLVTAQKGADKLYMRGTGSDPYIYVAEKSDVLGLKSVSLEAASEEDFLAAAKFSGASEIKSLEGPGGGRSIRFNVPGGITFDLVYGLAEVEELPLRPMLPFNAGITKQRKNKTQRPPCEPAQAIRLGHLALAVTDATAAKEWLATHFGFLVSDTILVPGTENVLGYFVRCDRGAIPADHHTFLLANSPTAGAHHISFEVEDLDALQMGSEWMSRRGREHHWGIGRHVLGSQLFDYWWDADGNRIEHYTDGDLFDNTVPPGAPVEGTDDSLWMWGPKFPADFFTVMRNKAA